MSDSSHSTAYESGDDGLAKADTAQPTQHEAWTDGDFELISSDNVRFAVPTYHLQSASAVFRDMIDAGSGLKSVQLDETAATIARFLGLATAGAVSFADAEGAVDWAAAVALVRFLRRFACAAATGHLAQYARVARAHGFCANVLRLLVAMHLDLRDVCERLVADEPDLFRWLRPTHRDCAAADLLPFHAFRLVPPHYMWALMAADIQNTEELRLFCVRSRKLVMAGPGRRFRLYLDRAEHPDQQ